MKIRFSILVVWGFLLLTVQAQISYRVERGLNVFKTWDADERLESDVRQTLSDGTNLVQQELYCIPTETSIQSLHVRRYQRSGSGTFWEMDNRSLIWLTDGNIQSNYWVPTVPETGVFNSGGSQGIRVFTSQGKRHQIIHLAVFNLYWRTNSDFPPQCAEDDDRASVIFWFRTNSVNSTLPWFVGAWTALAPEERKLVSVPPPLGNIWYHMGIDKCIDCGNNCWLTSWPTPLQTARATPVITPTPSGYTLRFAGAPGADYALQRSSNLADWTTVAAVRVPEDGWVQYEDKSPPGPRGYYRMVLPELMDPASANLASLQPKSQP